MHLYEAHYRVTLPAARLMQIGQAIAQQRQAEQGWEIRHIDETLIECRETKVSLTVLPAQIKFIVIPDEAADTELKIQVLSRVLSNIPGVGPRRLLDQLARQFEQAIDEAGGSYSTITLGSMLRKSISGLAARGSALVNAVGTASAMPEQAVPTAPHGRIFISYRRADSADVTGRIYDRLIGHFGRDIIFKDVDSIPLGVDFRAHLQNVIGECGAVLAVIGADWLTVTDDRGRRRLDDPGDYVRIEIETALARGIPVVPLLVRGAGMPAQGDLPESLHALVFRNAIPVRSDPDFHHDLDRLISGLATQLK